MCATAESNPIQPLVDCYRAKGMAVPSIETLPGDVLPEPYRSLLVHERDMTSTLEEFHGGKVRLRVLNQSRNHETYVREVVLVAEPSRKAVEYGAIRIRLHAFPSNIQAAILKGDRPLGAILNDSAISYVSRPKSFVRVSPDASMTRALGLTGTSALFGRCNEIHTTTGETVADIVEILPVLTA